MHQASKYFKYVDADVTAYMQAIGIANDSAVYYSGTAQERTGRQLWTYVISLVSSLKTSGLWDKCKVIYPFLGGTASAHKFNLKDPRDLDIAFRILWSVSGLTHSSTGVLGNGGYGDTYYNPNAHGQLASAHLSFYSRTNTTSSNIIACGCGSGNGNFYQINPATGGNIIVNSSISGILYWQSLTDTRKFYLANRQSSLILKAHLNNSVNGLSSNNLVGSAPNLSSCIFGRREGPSTITYLCTLECIWHSLGNGLTDAEASDYYTIVNDFQTSLNRL